MCAQAPQLTTTPFEFLKKKIIEDAEAKSTLLK